MARTVFKRDYSLAVSLYESGLSVAEVARRFSISRQGMWQILKVRGCVIRRKYGKKGKIWGKRRSNMKIEDIARVAHQINKAYCEALGDFSQADWEAAPEWQRESAIAGVNFQLANPEAPASASHESWFAQKVADGWKYGPAKNPEKKEHPCMVAFKYLPRNQQVKDHLFKAVVASLAA